MTIDKDLLLLIAAAILGLGGILAAGGVLTIAQLVKAIKANAELVKTLKDLYGKLPGNVKVVVKQVDEAADAVDDLYDEISGG